MEEILEQLKAFEAGVKIEKDSFTDALRERQSVINSHSKSLDGIAVSIRKVVVEFEKKILSLVKEEKRVKESLDEVNKELLAKKKDMKDQISVAENVLEKLNKDIAHAEEKSISINKTNSGLMSEYNLLDEKLTSIRCSIASSERHMNGLIEEEKALGFSINSKKQELGILDEKIEESRQTYSKLSSDVSILEARKNKLQ